MVGQRTRESKLESWLRIQRSRLGETGGLVQRSSSVGRAIEKQQRPAAAESGPRHPLRGLAAHGLNGLPHLLVERQRRAAVGEVQVQARQLLRRPGLFREVSGRRLTEARDRMLELGQAALSVARARKRIAVVAARQSGIQVLRSEGAFVEPHGLAQRIDRSRVVAHRAEYRLPGC